MDVLVLCSSCSSLEEMLEVQHKFLRLVEGGFLFVWVNFDVLMFRLSSGCISSCVRYDDEERHCVRNLLVEMYV